MSPVNPEALHDTSPASTSPALTKAARDMALRAGSHQAEQRLLFNAEIELTRRCMLAYGFNYLTSSGGRTIDDSEWYPNLNARRADGYGMATPTQPVQDSQMDDLSRPEKARYIQALSGDPDHRATLRLRSGPTFTFNTTGCIAESRIALYGNVMDAARVSYIPQEAFLQLHNQIADNHIMRDSIGRWAACMHGRGFPFDSPGEARSAVADTYANAREQGRNPVAAQELEIEIAVADGECALNINLPRVADQLGLRYSTELPPDQRRDLNAVANLRAMALRRTGAVIDASATAAHVATYPGRGHSQKIMD